MINCYHPRQAILVCLLTITLYTEIHAQTIIGVMDFDGTAPELPLTTDVPFFDNNSDGFFGIHDANDDPGDGAPPDTGDGNASDVAAVNAAPVTGDFLFLNDLDDEGDNGTAGEATVTFGPVDVTARAAVVVSFDFNVSNFNTPSDYAKYRLLVDGIAQPEVDLVIGASGGVSRVGNERIRVPDGAASVALQIVQSQNGGDDRSAFDNIIVSADNADDPCGIRGFGPAEVVCLTEATQSGTDLFEIRIPYIGSDADATLTVLAGATTPANDVTATTVNTGDDFTTEPNGAVVLTNSAGEFEEGDEILVSVTDAGGACSYNLPISTTENQCSNPCDPNINPNNITFICEANTTGNDPGTAIVPFTNGGEPGVQVSIDAVEATISGDDPATDGRGDLIVEGLTEGRSYVLTLSGGGCTGDLQLDVPFTFDTGRCQASPLVINEVNFDPNGQNFDANRDGIPDNGGDEFVELINNGSADLDVSGFTVADNAGVFFTFSEGTVIPVGAGFVVFGVAPVGGLGCPTGASTRRFGSGPTTIGLGTRDYVLISDGAGNNLASLRYALSSGFDQSFARSPDLTGAFVGHTEITANPATASPCTFNAAPDSFLPIELLSFTAAATTKAVELYWSTGYETDSDYFTVARSGDGRVWQELGVTAAGPDAANRYHFTDDSPPEGTHLYRLYQTDRGGATTVYGPVSATFRVSRSLALYPNPTTRRLSLNRTVEAGDVVVVTSVTGKILRRLPPGSHSVDVRDLPAGLYLLSFDRGPDREVRRFVKR